MADSICIYWLKRDFRLTDNPALTAALAGHGTVVPVFILEPSALNAPETSALHVHAQTDAFNGLYHEIGRAGGALAFAHAEVTDCLERLYERRPFNELVSHLETGNNRTFDRDRAVAVWCKAKGVSWTEYRQTGVFRGPLDRDKRHRDWKKFYEQPLLPVPHGLERLRVPEAYREVLETNFPEPYATEKRRSAADDVWFPHEKLYGAKTAGPLRPDRFGFPLTAEQSRYVQPVTAAAAEVTLASFLHERGINYSKGMSSPNLAFYHCSRLSVHFAWGTMSGRTAYRRVHDRIEALKESTAENAGVWRKNLRSFLSRLHWRDHFTQRLETEVEMEHRPLNPNFWELKLENDPAFLEAWAAGKTGYPMADACIRCLQTTGYVNFRMRAMLTSLAAHVLHLDFRSVDKIMARLYTDYEPGIHLAQLQMQSGMVGINTLRAYSPDKQMLDHDAEAAFVHRWVPELRPFTAKEIAKRDLSVGLGDYPPVLADRQERVRAYAKQLNELKYRPGGREITEEVFRKHGSRRGPRRKKPVKKASAAAG